jgi:hypothetical protein
MSAVTSPNKLNFLHKSKGGNLPRRRTAILKQVGLMASPFSGFLSIGLCSSAISATRTFWGGEMRVRAMPGPGGSVYFLRSQLDIYISSVRLTINNRSHFILTNITIAEFIQNIGSIPFPTQTAKGYTCICPLRRRAMGRFFFTRNAFAEDIKPASVFPSKIGISLRLESSESINRNTKRLRFEFECPKRAQFDLLASFLMCNSNWELIISSNGVHSSLAKR